jgi:hypothetical protein
MRYRHVYLDIVPGALQCRSNWRTLSMYLACDYLRCRECGLFTFLFRFGSFAKILLPGRYIKPDRRCIFSSVAFQPDTFCFKTFDTVHQNFPLLLFLSLINSSCSRIPCSSCRCLSLVSSSNRACSFFNSVNSSSSFSCHGYRTNIWKHNAEEPMTKFVREKPRVKSIAIEILRQSCLFFGFGSPLSGGRLVFQS